MRNNYSQKKNVYLFSAEFWNKFALRTFYKPYFFPQLYSSYLQQIQFIEKNIDLNNTLILKTDMYVESQMDIVLFFERFKGNKFIVMDISLNVLKKAREYLVAHGIEAEYIVADVRNLPFRRETFDFIFSDSTLDHIPQKELGRALMDIKAFLRKDGSFCFSINNRYNYFLTLAKRIYKILGMFPFVSFSFYPKEILTILMEQKWIISDFDYSMLLLPFQILILKVMYRLKRPKEEVINFISSLDKTLRKFHFLNKFVNAHFIYFLRNG